MCIRDRKWVERMWEAGLVGMGGAGFPTHKKYQGPPVDTVLVNGCECEPYLTCDHRIMLERTERVIEGALALGRAAGCLLYTSHGPVRPAL